MSAPVQHVPEWVRRAQARELPAVDRTGRIVVARKAAAK
jgi:hypothetical protein